MTPPAERLGFRRGDEGRLGGCLGRVALAGSRSGDGGRQWRAKIDALHEDLEDSRDIIDPPGDPTAMKGAPSRRTMVGAMELRGRLPPSTRLGWVVESKLKSVNSLLSKNP